MLSHLGLAALILAILVSILTVFATLSLTSEQLKSGSAQSSQAQGQNITTHSSAVVAQQRQLLMDRADLWAVRAMQRLGEPFLKVTDTTRHQRQLQMDRADFEDWLRR
jgi:hypothetical protein